MHEMQELPGSGGTTPLSVGKRRIPAALAEENIEQMNARRWIKDTASSATAAHTLAGTGNAQSLQGAAPGMIQITQTTR